MEDLLIKLKKSILNNNNIIIHYLEDEKLSGIKNEFYKLLEKNNYAIFKGISAYNYHCKLNSGHVDFDNFWIEEKNTNLLLSIFDEYDYYEVL